MIPEYPNSGRCNRTAPPPTTEAPPVPRACNPDLMKDWKVPLPATLAGAVELELFDHLTGKPRYGERSKLIAYLLSEWLQRRGRRIEVDLPSEDLLHPVEDTRQ